MSPYVNRSWARSWWSDILAAVGGSLLCAVALAGVVVGLLVLVGHVLPADAKAADLLVLLAGIALPPGMAGGLTVARACRRRRVELGGITMWRARFGGISMMGMACGALATMAAFPLLIPACDRLGLGAQAGPDPFLITVLALVFAGGSCGAAGTSLALLLRRPSRP